MDPVRARARFLEYIDRLNELNKQPSGQRADEELHHKYFYSTRGITRLIQGVDTMGLADLLNGKLDEKAYREGAFAGNFPFAEFEGSRVRQIRSRST